MKTCLRNSQSRRYDSVIEVYLTHTACAEGPEDGVMAYGRVGLHALWAILELGGPVLYDCDLRRLAVFHALYHHETLAVGGYIIIRVEISVYIVA